MNSCTLKENSIILTYVLIFFSWFIKKLDCNLDRQEQFVQKMALSQNIKQILRFVLCGISNYMFH